ncbi:hypothetical protein [Metabacillus sp. 84]|uniref:hypothetical protein n=1 Tax=unclassified Metabacillus TaxID=2675274 RepID=UPI003CF1F1B6
MEYTNEQLPEMIDIEQEAMKTYEKAAGGAVDENEIAKVIEETVVPAYTKMSEKANALEITDEELQRLHERFTASIEENMKGIELMADSITNQDEAMLKQGSELLDKVSSERKSFKEDLEAYAIENDLEMEEPKE